MPRESGASSTPWLLESITDISGILVHPLSRVMTYGGQTQLRDLAAGLREVDPLTSRHLKIRGRRECRAPDAPAVLRAKMRVARTQVVTVTPETPGIPRAMVYGLFRALPGDRALLPPSFRRNNPAHLNASVGAPGPHDFAVRFKRARLTAPSASTATRLTSVTIAKRPSWRGGMICFYSRFYRVVKLISEIQK